MNLDWAVRPISPQILASAVIVKQPTRSTSAGLSPEAAAD